MVKLSVVVPVYNSAVYLQQCIDSILNQRYFDFELVLIDDGSKDGSGAICDRAMEADSRVRVIHRVNGGVSSARNAGLEASLGEWVCFIDSDDLIDDGYFDMPFEKSIDLFVRNQLQPGIKMFPAQVVRDEGMLPFLQDNAQEHRFRTVIGAFFKREILVCESIRFEEGFRLGEDTLFMMDYLKCCHAIGIQDGANYIYRKADDWDHKYKLSWKETEAYLTAFCDRYDKLPIPLPSLARVVFYVMYVATEKTGAFKLKWSFSEPVLRYKRTQLPMKGFKYRLTYVVSAFIARACRPFKSRKG